MPTRLNAIQASYRIADDLRVSLPMLADLLNDPQPQVRDAVTRIFERHPAETYESVIRVLDNDAPDVRRNALELLQFFLHASLAQGGSQTAMSAAAYFDGRTSWALMTSRLDKDAIEVVTAALRRLTSDPDAGVRAESLFLLVATERGSIAETKRFLHDRGLSADAALMVRPDRDNVEAAVLKNILRFGPDAVALLPELLEMLNQPWQSSDLVAVGSPYTDRFGDDCIDYHGRIALVLKALEQIGPPAVVAIPVLEKRLNDLPDQQRPRVAVTLLKLGVPADVWLPYLVTTLTLPDSEDSADWRGVVHGKNLARWYAGRQLARFHPEEARRQVSKLLPRFQLANGKINTQAVCLIWAMAPAAKEAVPLLLRYVPCDDSPVYWHCVEILGEIGSDASVALPVLRSIGSDKSTDPEIRRRVMLAIPRIEGVTKSAE
ncbi:MAG: hypothetical protein JSS02_18250 [Planctomycetes bacterium]|nr:hypothetical protein [Planctomycetota bacterium]